MYMKEGYSMLKVLFVCTGNTCRSPMAEAILKSYDLPHIEVRSAGVYAANGHEASYFAKEVLRDHQIGHQHHSTTLSHHEVEWATLILTMTRTHAAIIKDLYPDESGKVYTLKEFVNKEEGYDVVDPYGGTKWHYEQTFNELSDLIVALKEKLGSR